MASPRKAPAPRLTDKQLDQIVERVKKVLPNSQQPRFQPGNPEGVEEMFSVVYPFIRSLIQKEPPLNLDTRLRSDWLLKVLHLEPNLEGVFTTVCQIDQNRGWELVGAEDQVSQFLPVFHGFEAAPGINGWRFGAGVTAQSFWGTDIGGIVETAQAGNKQGAWLGGLFATDPTRCRLMKNSDLPLRYYYPTGIVVDGKRKQFEDWAPDTFFRVTSMISPLETLRGIGRCAVSRCIELAKIMAAIYEYDSEQLGAKMPNGIMTIHGISDDQWKQALKTRNAELSAMGRDWFGGVMVLANAGADQIDIKLTALSNLPANFNQQVFTNILMYTYALCFGYDPREFWPVSSGSLGTGNETNVQQQKAMYKGRMEYALTMQEMLQNELPESIHFEFEQSDTSGELLEAQKQSAKMDMIVKMFTTVNSATNESLISLQQAQTLAAEAGLIPREWTIDAEDTKATDTNSGNQDPDEPEALKDVNQPKPPAPTATITAKPAIPIPAVQQRYQKERIMSIPEVRRALKEFPQSQIVRYHWPENKVTTIFQNASQALARENFYSIPSVTRAKDGTTLYRAGGIVITSKDALAAIEEGRKRIGDAAAEVMLGNVQPEVKEVGRGGPGSGFFSHEGRKGEVGGSLPGLGSGHSKVTDFIEPWKLTYAEWEKASKPPEPKPGDVILYHRIRDPNELPQILNEGLMLSKKSKGGEGPSGVMWFATEPTGYSKYGTVIGVEVPREDADLEAFGKGQAATRRDVKPSEIVWVDMDGFSSVSSGNRISFEAASSYSRKYHETYVHDALEAGKTVPQKVLNEYPDIKNYQAP